MVKAVLTGVACITLLAATACQNTPRKAASSSADSNGPAQRSIVVSTAADLVHALTSAAAGTTVLLQSGEYEISRTLIIPDGVTLLGSGAMRLDAHDRLPIGFEPESRTVLRSTAGFQGDVLVLRNRSVVRGLTIEDVAGRSEGNVVVARARGDGEAVSTTLEDCEVINPKHPDSNTEGPSGSAVVAITPSPTASDGVGVGSSVELRMSHCIVRSPFGSGVFATNFGSRSRIIVVLTNNVIVGGLSVSGAASRSLPVSGASATVESRGNLFRADSATPPNVAGWFVTAAATPHRGITPSSTSKNSLHMRSTGDQIVGFHVAIVASGASRLMPEAGILSENEVTLELRQTEIKSLGADLVLSGARSRSAGALRDVGNVLRVDAAGLTGSGSRKNSFLVTDGPPGTTWPSGNRLEFTGTAVTFARANPRIIPSPTQKVFHVER